jgi:hypothetical protein
LNKDETGCFYYKLDNSLMPWGDYGAILLSGMVCYRDREQDSLQLERTGPFVPPITDSGSGSFIVTEVFKQKLEQSGLTGFTFKSVIKKRIVKLDWHLWDRELGEPPLYPAGGEPEDYILKRKHNSRIAEKIGNLWEIVVLKRGQVERRKTKKTTDRLDYDIYFVEGTWPGVDFIRAEGIVYVYVTLKAKKWLDENAGDWLSFNKVLIA